MIEIRQRYTCVVGPFFATQVGISSSKRKIGLVKCSYGGCNSVTVVV